MQHAKNAGLFYICYILLRLAGVPIEIFPVLLFVFAIGWPIGWFIGTLIDDDTDVDTPKFKAVAWANLFAWIIPFAGIAVAKLTSTIGKAAYEGKLFYGMMSVAGYGLVILSVSIFISLDLSGSFNSAEPEVTAKPSNSSISTAGERTYARCPYAAIEVWSREDIRQYCNREPTAAEVRALEAEHERTQAAQN